MFFFTLGEILNSNLSSLQEQLECINLFKLNEVDENLKTIPNYPNDRIISCLILILIFTSLDKPEQNSEKETFFLRLQNIQFKMEMSLKSYLECRFGSYKELLEQCRRKIEIVKQIAEI